MIGRAALSFSVVLTLTACASSSPAPIYGAGTTKPRPPSTVPSKPTTPPVPQDFVLAPVAFGSIPGWGTSDLAPALTAFKRQCDNWKNRTPDTALTGGRYGGKIGDWLAACNGALTIQPGQERWFFESYFDPQYVNGPGEAKLTSYFEPVVQASREWAEADRKMVHMAAFKMNRSESVHAIRSNFIDTLNESLRGPESPR